MDPHLLELIKAAQERALVLHRPVLVLQILDRTGQRDDLRGIGTGFFFVQNLTGVSRGC